MAFIPASCGGGTPQYKNEKALKNCATLKKGTVVESGDGWQFTNAGVAFTCNQSGTLFIRVQTSGTALPANTVFWIYVNNHMVGRFINGSGSIPAWQDQWFNWMPMWVNEGDTVSISHQGSDVGLRLKANISNIIY